MPTSKFFFLSRDLGVSVAQWLFFRHSKNSHGLCVNIEVKCIIFHLIRGTLVLPIPNFILIVINRNKHTWPNAGVPHRFKTVM